MQEKWQYGKRGIGAHVHNNSIGELQQEKQIRKLILKNKDNIYLKEFYYSYGRIPNCNFVVYKTSYVRLTQIELWNRGGKY